MELNITEEYKITSDPHQWVIQRKRTRKGTTEWRSLHYFPTLEQAVRGLGELMVRASEARTVPEALRDVQDVATQLSQALTLCIEDSSDEVREKSDVE